MIDRDGAIVLMNALRVRPYTTSVDCALLLVPEGLDWGVDWRAGESDATVGEYLGQGRTPALSLCLAALRARGIEG